MRIVLRSGKSKGHGESWLWERAGLRVVVDVGRSQELGKAAAEHRPAVTVLTHDDADHIGGWDTFVAHATDATEVWVPWDWGRLLQARCGLLDGHSGLSGLPRWDHSDMQVPDLGTDASPRELSLALAHYFGDFQHSTFPSPEASYALDLLPEEAFSLPADLEDQVRNEIVAQIKKERLNAHDESRSEPRETPQKVAKNAVERARFALNVLRGCGKAVGVFAGSMSIEQRSWASRAGPLRVSLAR